MTVDDTRRYKPGANKRPRGWHRGVGQDALWEAAAARLDAARLAEGVEDPRAAADPVVASVRPAVQNASSAATSADLSK